MTDEVWILFDRYDLSGNACVKNVVESYLVQGNTPAADIKC